MLSTSSKRSSFQFSDIAHNITERVNPSKTKSDVYVGLEHLSPDSIHLLKWGHPSDVIGDKFVFRKGDVIFGKRRAYQRKLAIADVDGICSAHAMVLRANTKTMLPEFLPFFLSSDVFMERAIGISVGSLSPTINWSTLKEEQFTIPTLEEQKRFVKVLLAMDEVNEKWVSTEHSIKQVQEKIVSSFLTLGKSADSTQCMRLSELLVINPRLDRAAVKGEDVSFIAMEDVSEDGNILKQSNRLYSDVSKGYTPFMQGDILFAKITPCMENGKGALVQTLDNPVGFGSTEFIVLRSKDERDRLFLFHLTHSRTFRRLAENWMQGSAGQRRVALDFFREEEFFLPPIEERIRIGLYLQELNDIAMMTQRHILLTRNLLKSTINGFLMGATDV